MEDRHPGVDRPTIESIVDDVREELKDTPIRDYVPVLVEHEVRDRLRDEEAVPVTAPQNP